MDAVRARLGWVGLGLATAATVVVAWVSTPEHTPRWNGFACVSTPESRRDDDQLEAKVRRELGRRQHERELLACRSELYALSIQQTETRPLPTDPATFQAIVRGVNQLGELDCKLTHGLEWHGQATTQAERDQISRWLEQWREESNRVSRELDERTSIYGGLR